VGLFEGDSFARVSAQTCSSAKKRVTRDFPAHHRQASLGMLSRFSVLAESVVGIATYTLTPWKSGSAVFTLRPRSHVAVDSLVRRGWVPRVRSIPTRLRRMKYGRHYCFTG